MMRSRIFATALVSISLAASSNPVQAESGPTLVVRMGDGAVDTSRLLMGIRRYLRYEIKGDHRKVRDIWTRTMSKVVRGGRSQLHLTQVWDEASPAPGAVSLLEQDSWFDATTFRPTTQVRRATNGGQVTVSGYRYTATGVVGMKDLPNNSRAEFALSYREWPYNFEYDMELFEALPLRSGLVINVPFYDAGIDENSDRYEFRIVGSARINGWDGRSVDCWEMTGDYHTGEIKNRFWFDKRTHILIREEAPLKDGGVFVKSLLPPEAGDAA